MDRRIVAGLMAMALVCGCSSPTAESYSEFEGLAVAGAGTAYGAPPALTTSLFKSDQAVNDLEQLTNGLSSKIWQKIMIVQPKGT